MRTFILLLIAVSLQAQTRVSPFYVATAATVVSEGPYIAVGSYTGNGTYSRAITGVGFQPKVVMIKGAGATEAIVRTSDVAGDSAFIMTTTNGLMDSLILSLGSDGFTVGDQSYVNANGTVYHWQAWAANTGYLATGTFTGNGTDDRNITGVGFQPNLVMILDNSTNANPSNVWTVSSIGNDSTFDFGNYLNPSSNDIQSFGADGFQVGSSWSVNHSDHIYYWVAFKIKTDYSWVGTYNGDNNSNRDITGASAQGNILWVRTLFDYEYTGLVASTESANKQLYFMNRAEAENNRFVSFNATGFRVNANWNTTGLRYFWYLWKVH